MLANFAIETRYLYTQMHVPENLVMSKEQNHHEKLWMSKDSDVFTTGHASETETYQMTPYLAIQNNYNRNT